MPRTTLVIRAALGAAVASLIVAASAQAGPSDAPSADPAGGSHAESAATAAFIAPIFRAPAAVAAPAIAGDRALAPAARPSAPPAQASALDAGGRPVPMIRRQPAPADLVRGPSPRDSAVALSAMLAAGMPSGLPAADLGDTHRRLAADIGGLPIAPVPR
ncbi:MAG: hypothetical protein AAF677_15755 [Pseudomonadota bacterium]